MILKTSKSTESTTQSRKGGVEVGDNSGTGQDSRYKLDGSEFNDIEIDSGKVKDNEDGKKD